MDVKLPFCPESNISLLINTTTSICTSHQMLSSTSSKSSLHFIKIWQLYGETGMSMLLIGSSAPPKRREKNQSKTRRSRKNSRDSDKTFENDSIFSEEAFYGDFKNQIAYKSTDQSGDEPVTTATPISTKSVAPTNEPQSFSKELYPLGFHAEVTGAPESLTSSDDCSWAFRELGGQYFAPDLPKHMTQIAGK